MFGVLMGGGFDWGNALLDIGVGGVKFGVEKLAADAAKKAKEQEAKRAAELKAQQAAAQAAAEAKAAADKRAAYLAQLKAQIEGFIPGVPWWAYVAVILVLAVLLGRR